MHLNTTHLLQPTAQFFQITGEPKGGGTIHVTFDYFFFIIFFFVVKLDMRVLISFFVYIDLVKLQYEWNV